MNSWIYFATAEKASLAATLGSVLNAQFLWRSAHNSKGALIANVAHIRVGDWIVVAWRHPGGRRVAYFRCRVAAPLERVEPNLVLDHLSGRDADALIAAGYPASAGGLVQGIRLDEIEECYFDVKGRYGGNNAIHPVAQEDLIQIANAGTIPPDELTERAGPPVARSDRNALEVSTHLARACVDQLEIRAEHEERAFDAYVMVDWSSSSHPVTGNDSIWIASATWWDRTFTADAPENVATRVKAVELLRNRIAAWRDHGKRVLVGFDFAFGYPTGFAAALGLDTVDGAWKALHSYFAENVRDTANNVHNRDTFAAECNRIIGAPGPFWGCARAAENAALTQQRLGRFSFPHHGLEEWRVTDLHARKRTTTQSVWKLNCGVSVGGQTILGIKHLAELARDVGAHRWPFDGWDTPASPAIWFAEIFPSLVHYDEWAAAYAAWKDRTQVQSCLRQAAERDRDRLLKGDFDAPRLDLPTLVRIAGEEGWILWV